MLQYLERTGEIQFKKKKATNFDEGQGHTTSVITGAFLLSPSGSVQQHGLCSSREPCTTKAEEEDTSDVIFTHSDSSLLLLLLLVMAGRESKAADRGECGICLHFSLLRLKFI